MGPSLQWHLGGGQGGLKHFMEHLLPGMVATWKLLGTPNVTPELQRTLADGVVREAAGRSGLPVEPPQHSRLHRICPVEQLHGDRPSESLVDATPDRRHAPAAQHGLQPVAVRYQLPVHDPHPDT